MDQAACGANNTWVSPYHNFSPAGEMMNLVRDGLCELCMRALYAAQLAHVGVTQINYLIISITIVVVAIPEGLPLSVSTAFLKNSVDCDIIQRPLR